MKSIYIASPYSNPDESTRQSRFEAVNRYAAKLMLQGFIVFSPLSHSVPIAEYIGNHNDSDFYVQQDLYWLKHCDEMHILMLDGWEDSKGVETESIFATNNKITILLIEVKEEP